MMQPTPVLWMNDFGFLFHKEVLPIKRWIAIFLIAAVCLSLVACSKKPQSEATSSPQGVMTAEEVFADAEVLAYNSLTGEPLAEGVAKGQRPVAIMVNNAQPALPQRGVTAADAVVEMATEGGITRLLALYSNPATIPQVGPVRSARDQHVQFSIPLNAVLVHIGNSVYAENLINMYSYQDIDGHYLGTQTFVYDAARATTRASEHCWYTDAALVANGIALQELETTGKSYPLLPFATADTKPLQPAEGAAPDVKFSYADNNFVQFTYDAASGLYKKLAYSEPHIDETTGEQLAFKNVLILFAEVGLKPDAYCADYNLSSGTGYYLYQGQYESIRWKKGNPENPLMLYDAAGKKELSINTGKSYIGIVGAERAEGLVMDVNAPVDESAVASSGASSQPAVSTSAVAE